MARKAIKIKNARNKKVFLEALSQGKKPEFSTKIYNRCKLCGRIGGFMRKFDLCRICFREKALFGKIPGLKKSSW